MGENGWPKGWHIEESEDIDGPFTIAHAKPKGTVHCTVRERRDGRREAWHAGHPIDLDEAAAIVAFYKAQRPTDEELRATGWRSHSHANTDGMTCARCSKPLSDTYWLSGDVLQATRPRLCLPCHAALFPIPAIPEGLTKRDKGWMRVVAQTLAEACCACGVTLQEKNGQWMIYEGGNGDSLDLCPSCYRDRIPAGEPPVIAFADVRPGMLVESDISERPMRVEARSAGEVVLRMLDDAVSRPFFCVPPTCSFNLLNRELDLDPLEQAILEKLEAADR